MKTVEKITSRIVAIQGVAFTKGNWKKWNWALLLVGMTSISFAQEMTSSTTIATPMVSVVAPYKEDVRNAILSVSQYPQILAKLAQIHDQTSQDFQATIETYSQKKQGWFYELSRYPDLMHQLASMPTNRSKADIEAMVPGASDELKTAAWKLYDHHHNDLVAVDNLNQNAQRIFLALIAPLDVSTQAAFQKLVDMPDVLSALNEHMDQTAQLGQSFKANPDAIRQRLIAAHDSLETQNKQALDAYKQSLAQNPEALQELQQASQDYAKTNGYQYKEPPVDNSTVNNYYYNPYPYWFGYPYWFTSAMWYPNMLWYNAGFYYGVGGYPMLYGMPSLGFSAWFFGGAYRYYPHLYRQFGNYYHTNLSAGRLATSTNSFLNVARSHFNPTMSGGSHWFANASNTAQSGRTFNQMGATSAPRTSNWSRGNSYSGQSFGGYSRGSFGGMSGGGFRGGFGGGGRGGRR
ncbi:MAG: hypothetical protein U0Y10_25135 [Spirosomataceae bacterium]